MSENSYDLLRFTLFNQGVVDNNVLLPWETEKVGIAVCASLASINDVQRFERKLESGGQCFNAGLKFARLEWGQLVEQRENEHGVNGNGEKLDDNTEQPQIVEEACTSDLNDLQEGAQQRDTQRDRQGLTLHHICQPEFDRLFVKTEFFFEDKSAVV